MKRIAPAVAAVIVALGFGVSAGTAVPRPAPKVVKYQPLLLNTKVWMSRNGRTVHFKTKTDLVPVRAKWGRTKCIRFPFIITVTPSQRRNPLLSRRRWVFKACHAGRSWSYRGWVDLMDPGVTPGVADVRINIPRRAYKFTVRSPLVPVDKD